MIVREEPWPRELRSREAAARVTVHNCLVLRDRLLARLHSRASCLAHRNGGRQVRSLVTIQSGGFRGLRICTRDFTDAAKLEWLVLLRVSEVHLGPGADIRVVHVRDSLNLLRVLSGVTTPSAGPELDVTHL